MQRQPSTLPHMVDMHGLSKGVPGLFVDTVYDFIETHETRDALSAYYDLWLLKVTLSITPDDQVDFFGRELWEHSDSYKLCCPLRKV